MSKDPINPDYYTELKISPRDLINQIDLKWDLANVVKYISRYENKNGLEDIDKAIKYLELYGETQHLARHSRDEVFIHEKLVQDYCYANDMNWKQREVLVNLPGMNVEFSSYILKTMIQTVRMIREDWLIQHAE